MKPLYVLALVLAMIFGLGLVWVKGNSQSGLGLFAAAMAPAVLVFVAATFDRPKA